MASKPTLLALAAAMIVAAACLLGAAEAKLGRLFVTGVVPCSTGSLIDIATSPAFPNAEVELRCAGKVVAGATTNINGSFTMEADLTSALAAFIGGCSLVVDTPLIKCDAQLPPAGKLVSYLKGPLTRLLGGIFHLFPAGFSFHGR
ncbi:phylloplanin [Lolium perenne]|uniref:phylloplanin n=1 Tax=Lolium perenne TaxID=4522 RepID=UPI0021F51264|nr:phylloplanin-like [Lolium perenne]